MIFVVGIGAMVVKRGEMVVPLVDVVHVVTLRLCTRMRYAAIGGHDCFRSMDRLATATLSVPKKTCEPNECADVLWAQASSLIMFNTLTTWANPRACRSRS